MSICRVACESVRSRADTQPRFEFDTRLVHRVALAGVQDNDVDAGLDEGRCAVAVAWPRADCGTDKQLLVRVLGRGGEVAVLLQIRARCEGDELVLVVDDGELALLGLAHDAVRLQERAHAASLRRESRAVAAPPAPP